MTELAWLDNDAPIASFPPTDRALRQPDGLLAAGGDLGVDRLLYAYQHGIFPWYEAGQPVLWWTPDPRCVLPTAGFHCSRSLRRTLRRNTFTITFDRAFLGVIDACAESRGARRSTWITPAMRAAYLDLHAVGYGRSVEVWRGESLVGGVYGVAIDRMFFGESMFSRETDASKVALLALCRALQAREMPLLDCQVASEHLLTLGAQNVPRAEFVTELNTLCSVLYPACPLPAEPITALSLLN